MAFRQRQSMRGNLFWGMRDDNELIKILFLRKLNNFLTDFGAAAEEKLACPRKENDNSS